MNQLLCQTQAHSTTCRCNTLRRYYGDRPFKCRLLNCRKRRHGFGSGSVRNSHEKTHNKPWKCNFSGCEFSKGGFLSRKMRDDHLENYHQQDDSGKAFHTDGLEANEFQALFSDVVATDNLDAVKALCSTPHFNELSYPFKQEILIKVAFGGSLAVFDTILSDGIQQGESFARYGEASIEGRNMEIFRKQLSVCSSRNTSKNPYWYCSELFPGVLASDTEEIWVAWEEHALTHRSHHAVKALASYTYEHILNATAGNPHRERLLLDFWSKLELPEKLPNGDLGAILVRVASTTCSVRIAEYLINAGARVNYRRSTSYLTALHHAARKDSAESANLMRFLLNCGADPDAEFSKARLRIRDEKGAKGIAKWLGLSWDELVVQTKRESETRKSRVLEVIHEV
jgi:hypothetical protein